MKRFLSYTFAFIFVFVFCLSGCKKNNSLEDDISSSLNENSTMANADVDTSPGTSKKRIALTFDDGPHNVRTRDIANELEKYGFHATFFVVGNRIGGSDVEYRGGETIKYLVEKGNEIGIHGYTHTKYYDKCSDEEYKYEIDKTLSAIHEFQHGYKVNLMRPVGGRISDERASNSPYSIILWNVDSLDWKYKYTKGDDELTCQQKVDKIVENVMSQIQDGSIVLMHDIYESTYDATKIILQKLNEEGYEVVTVSELLENPIKGEIYRSGN